jgi:hypothetical protein
MRKRQTRKARQPRRARAAAPLPNDLNAVSRALLGPDEDKRAYRPARDDASIEDPLLDWPEDS